MQKINFNKTWTFFKFGEEKDSKTVDLPHDAQIYENRSPELPMDSGYFPGGKYVYVKDYPCPAEFADKAIYLEFDGIYMNAEIFVNGQRIQFQPYGYTLILIPIHEYLKFGESNEIKVVADNSQFPNARWYTGAGIYRDVYLYVGTLRHICPYGVKIDTIEYAPAKISVAVEAAGMQDCTVKTDIIFDGEVVASTTGSAPEINIPDAKLWSDKNPNLYTAKVQLLHEGEVVDEKQETFGIRKIEQKASFGLKINGEITLLRGGCIHHDNGLLGAAVIPQVEERKVKKLKEAGFNAIRSSHNPCSRALLDACDKYGMYVMDEFADMWIQHKHKYDYAGQFREWYERDLTAMVNRCYNHPSVIMYSIGNEVGESATPEGGEYARKMTELLHSLDSRRPVTCGINILLNGLTSMGKGLYKDDGMSVNSQSDKGKEKKESGSTFINGVMSNMGKLLNNIGRLKRFDEATREVFSVLDIAGYNYGSGRYKIDPKKYPDRVTVGSETFPPTLYENWQNVKQYPNLIGDFMWTAWDYLGEAGIGVAGYKHNGGGILKKYPMLLAGCGVIDITGEARPEVHWNKCIWGLEHKPYLAVEPVVYADEKAGFGMWRSSDAVHSWAWPGHEGKKTTVIVYTAADSVELRQEGRRIGRKPVKKCKAVFHNVEYQQGKLEAVAFDANGRETGQDILYSAGDNYRLQVLPERDRFHDSELLYVNIFLTDEKDIRVYGKDVAVAVALSGGELLAFGSAEPFTKEGFHGNRHKTFNGKVQAIIRPCGGADTIELKATSENIIPGQVTIKRK